MIDRVEAQFDIKPERLIGDTAVRRMKWIGPISITCALASSCRWNTVRCNFPKLIGIAGGC